MRKRLVLCAIGLALLAGCHGGAATSGPLNVPLVYQPKDESMSSASNIIRGQLAVNVLDERTRKDAIGQNQEEATPKLVVTTDDPAKFVREVAVRQLESRGATVATAPAAATKTLVLHLQNFWTVETDTYQTQIRIRGEVVDNYGKVLWEALATGQGSNFGRSLNAVNYQECISEATYKAVGLLLNEPGLAAALGGSAPVRADQAK